MKRNTVRDAALIAGLFIAGGVCGVGVYKGTGGLNEQHAQLEQCVLASRHWHPEGDARSRLAHLEAEVPICMKAAGYEQALDGKSCSLKVWQGDVFCYLPKSFFGKLIYRIQSRTAESLPRDG